MKHRYHTLIIAMLFCGAVLPLCLTNTAAHSASAVLTYDDGTEELSALIYHDVSSPTTHYVKSVAITINSVLNVTHTYDSQPTIAEFSYNYTLQLVDGDNVSVKLSCNEGGDFTALLTIGDEPTTSDDSSTDGPSDGGNSIPGYSAIAGMLTLLTLGALLRTISRRRQ